MNIKNKALIALLFAVLIISLTAVSAADDMDNLTDDNIADDEVITQDSHQENEGYIEFEKDKINITENEQDVNIKGTLYYWEEYPYTDGEVDFYCNYTDGNGQAQSYQTTASYGSVEVNIKDFEGLTARDSPYQLTFSPIKNGNYDYFVSVSGEEIVDCHAYLTVKAGSQEAPTPVYDADFFKLEYKDIYEGSESELRVEVKNKSQGNIALTGIGDIAPQKLSSYGATTFTIPTLNVGTYIVNVTYVSEDKTKSYFTNVTLQVKQKETPTIFVNVTDIREGDIAKITVILPFNATGNVTLNSTVKNDTYKVHNNLIINAAVANFQISDLTKGTYTVHVNYTGDKRFNPIAGQATFNVKTRALLDIAYASEAGNDIDGNGSYNNPFKTIQTAIDCLNEKGEIILLTDAKGDGNRKINANKSFTIIGNGHAIDAEEFTQILTIGEGAYVKLENITVKNGYGAAESTITNNGDLTAINCKFTQNSISMGSGGVIYNNGNLNIKDSEFTNNRAGRDYGALYAANGAAIYNNGSCNIEDTLFENNVANGTGCILNKENLNIVTCTFRHNTAYSGGAISNTGTLSIENSCFESNIATTASGGAVYSIGNLTVDNSLFKANTAQNENLGHGGAIFSYNLTLTNSNFTLNEAKGGYGGAVYAYKYTASIDGCNFTNNYASKGNSVSGYESNVTIENSILTSDDESPIISGRNNTNITTNNVILGNETPQNDNNATNSTPSNNNTNNTANTTNKIIIHGKKTVSQPVLKAKKTVKVKKSTKKLVLKATLKQDNKPLKNKKVIFKFKGKKYTVKTDKNGVAKLTLKKKVLKTLKKGKKYTVKISYLKNTVKTIIKVK